MQFSLIIILIIIVIASHYILHSFFLFLFYIVDISSFYSFTFFCDVNKKIQLLNRNMNFISLFSLFFKLNTKKILFY